MKTTCIICGTQDRLLLRIEDPAETIHCLDCTGTFTIADVKERIAQMNDLVRRCKVIRSAIGPANAS